MYYKIIWNFKKYIVGCLFLYICTLPSITSATELTFDVTSERSIKTMLEKAIPFIEEVTGRKYKKKTEFILAEKNVAYEIFYQEFYSQLKRVSEKNSNYTNIKQHAKSSAQIISQSSLGKYSLLEKKFIIIPGNIKTVAKMFDLKDRSLYDFIFLLVTHEMVHALDDQYFNIQQKIENITDTTGNLQAFNALVEGHAVYVTNKIAERLNISEEVRQISAKSDAKISRPYQEQQQYYNIIYVQGYEFVKTIIEKKGYSAIETAFISPPSSIQLIMNPEEYLNPSRIDTIDCLKLLEKIAKFLPNQDMQLQIKNADSMYLKINLIANGISERHANAIAKDCIGGAMIIAKDPSSKRIMVTAQNFLNSKSAIKRLELGNKMKQIVETRFKKQPNASYTVLKEEELKLEGFDSVYYRHVEGKVNNVTTIIFMVEGLIDTLYVDMSFINMRREITENRIAEILTLLSKERLKML